MWKLCDRTLKSLEHSSLKLQESLHQLSKSILTVRKIFISPHAGGLLLIVIADRFVSPALDHTAMSDKKSRGNRIFLQDNLISAPERPGGETPLGFMLIIRLVRGLTRIGCANPR